MAAAMIATLSAMVATVSAMLCNLSGKPEEVACPMPEGPVPKIKNGLKKSNG
jgi:hypothetical protein